MTCSTMVKAVPPHRLAGEMVPLTLFDRAILDCFVALTMVYPAPTPSNEALKEGLCRAVTAYPRVAGRLVVDQHGRRCIHFNNEGVLVVEAAVDLDLANASLDMDAMYPTQAPPEENIAAALLQIKLTRYKCGSLVLGLACHHQVVDGVAGAVFRKTWARAVRQGAEFTAPPFPFADPAVRRNPGRQPMFDHGSIEFKPGTVAPTYRKTKTVKLRFTSELVAELKARVGAPYTRFECLLAHLWKKKIQAGGLKPEEFTRVRVAVDCRGRAEPPVRPDFFGNMVLWAYPRLLVRDVLGWSYARVVCAIREAIARVDADYIRSFLDFGSLADAHGLELTATAPPACFPDLHLDVANWLGFGHNQLDFGGGPPSLLLLPQLPADGSMVLVSRSDEVHVSIAVEEDHATAFHQICYSFDFVSHL